jgi:hypothetical protein
MKAFSTFVGFTMLLVCFANKKNCPELTLFLPTTARDIGYFKNLYHSLVNNLIPPYPEIFIIVPDAHAVQIRGKISLLKKHYNSDMDIFVYVDSDAAKISTTTNSGNNWALQQVLKLSAYQFVNTSFYLVMDSDNFLVRPLRCSDLVKEGKGTTDFINAGTHISSWITRSANTLGFDSDMKKYTINGNTFGVTPQLLSRELCARLINYMSVRAAEHNMSWDKWLLSGARDERNTIEWTEYGLYFTFAVTKNLFNTYHTAGKILRGALWQNTNLTTFDFDSLFHNSALPGYFGLFQSARKENSSFVWNFFKPYFQTSYPEGVVYVLHARDHSNVGDMMSTPSLYLPDLSSNVQYLSVALNKLPNFTNRDLLIVGGGGLLDQKPAWNEIITSAASRLSTVGWGLGLNANIPFAKLYTNLSVSSMVQLRQTKAATKKLTPSKVVSMFALLGIRDELGDTFRWVPCASALSPLLSKAYPVKWKYGIFMHKHVAFNIPEAMASSYKVMFNNVTCMADVVEFLGNSEIVLTSSYHGMYWATLLGKRVIVCQPFSSKFLLFKYPPAVLLGEWTSADLEKALSSTTVYPDSLRECREANMKFYYDIKAFLYKRKFSTLQNHHEKTIELSL